jgi:hypothetical protein
VTEAPKATATRADAQKLAQTIRANPGKTQTEVLAVSGVATGRARLMLEQFDGQYWCSKRGAHNAKLFFPLEVPATVEIEV